MIERRLVSRPVSTLGTLIAPNRTQVQGPSIVTEGLVLHLDAGNPYSYPATGTTWTDVSGSGNNATLLNSPSYSFDRAGTLAFDGVDEYATIPDANSLDLPGDFTIEICFKTNSIYSGTPYPGGLINHRRSDNAENGTWILGIDNGQMTFVSAQLALVTTKWGTVASGIWYVATVSRIGSTIRMYLNAVEGASVTDSRNYTNANQVVLGAWGSTLSNWAGTVDGLFDGSMGVARIYKGKGLSAAEVFQNYQSVRWRFGI